jgi:hypothetical protein
MDNNSICEYSGLPNVQSYEPKEGAGVGGESKKEIFIDSSLNSEVTGSKSSDFMYNWIRKHSGK